MRHTRALAISFILGSVVAGVTAACGDSGNSSSGTGATSTGGTAGNGGTTKTGGTGGNGGGIGGGIGGGGPECTTNDECNGGVCVNGVCCASAELACAGTCCDAGNVCLFDKCVLPGKPCHTQNDCDPGQYCETALGDNGQGGGGGGGAGGAGGMGCIAPVPLEGKCLDLPPVCDEMGNPPGCIPACEYHPPPGQLDATVRWDWGTNAVFKPNAIDVWSTPTVGRVYDGNCDGKVDQLDPPNVVFVSAASIDSATGKGTCCQCTGTTPTACHRGVLRMLDGRTGQEIWNNDQPNANSTGFAGMSVALGDVDGDGNMDILAVTGEGLVVMLDSKGNVVRTSDNPIPGNAAGAFGWGGGLSVADMDHDGFPEIAFAATVFTTTNNTITRLWTGASGTAGGATEALSTFVDLDGVPDGNLELLAGKTAYRTDGTMLWDRPGLPEGFPAVGDFDQNGSPEVVYIASGNAYLLDGLSGGTLMGPLALPGSGAGGPPTVADFDGDGKPEIGVAQQNKYTVLKPNYGTLALDVVWTVENHDLSSSVTGSSVFDFEGDGKAEVIYADECFLWVYDGQTGAVRFSASHSSFTATEASLVADVDGDGHSEIVMVSNRADPSNAGWKCMDAAGNPSVVNGVTWTPSPAADKAYAGVKVFGDKANSWVGTRTLWNEHTYHVSNICDDRDSACDAPNLYGSIPKNEKPNWTLPWLNNFRQNVQDKGIFNAPDPTVSLSVECLDPVPVKVSVRNLGLASLPEGVQVGVYKTGGAGDTLVGQTATTHALFPGQTEVLSLTLDPAAKKEDTFVAKILVDPQNPTFHECKEDNNQSEPEKASCIQ